MWVARWERKAEQCPEHGVPRAVCADPDKHWFPRRQVDYATMQREAAHERYRRLHEARPWHDGTFKKWHKEPSLDFPYRYDMGVTIDVTETDENPDDDFLRLSLGSGGPGRVGSGEDEAEDAEADERGEG